MADKAKQDYVYVLEPLFANGRHPELYNYYVQYLNKNPRPEGIPPPALYTTVRYPASSGKVDNELARKSYYELALYAYRPNSEEQPSIIMSDRFLTPRTPDEKALTPEQALFFLLHEDRHNRHVGDNQATQAAIRDHGRESRVAFNAMTISECRADTKAAKAMKKTFPRLDPSALFKSGVEAALKISKHDAQDPAIRQFMKDNVLEMDSKYQSSDFRESLRIRTAMIQLAEEGYSLTGEVTASGRCVIANNAPRVESQRVLE